jgi:hypothetical protein
MDEIYVEFGMTIEDLIDEYGYEELAMASVFEVECECGEVYRLEPDGHGKCHECGRKIASPLITAGLI